MRTTPRIHKLAWGNAGIAQTVEHMWRYILGADPERAPARVLQLVRNQAEAILRAYGVQFAPNALHAAAIHDWIQEHLAYVGDHVFIEEIRAPADLLAEIAEFGSAMGDCDDFLVLEGALAVAIGIRPRIVTISTHADGLHDHTYLILDTTMGALIADPILKDEAGRPLPFGAFVPPEVITNYAESALPASLEAIGLDPRKEAPAA